MKNSHSDPCSQIMLNESWCYGDAYYKEVLCVMYVIKRFCCNALLFMVFVWNLFNVSWSQNFPAVPDEAVCASCMFSSGSANAVLFRIKLKHITWVDWEEKCVYSNLCDVPMSAVFTHWSFEGLVELSFAF